MTELPAFVPTTRKDAFRAGAGLIEQEIRRLRARAMSLDGHPYGQQYTTEPTGGEAERLVLEVLHLASTATILRELERQEGV